MIKTPAALVAAIYLVSIAATLSPLLWVNVPPLVDYPGYLARMAILAAPAASQNYTVHWQLIPNLSMDLIVPPFVALIGVETAGRLFIAVTMILPVAATALLHRTLYGRVGLWPLASLMFVYNKVLYFGFLNFLFGLGVALLCFALWIAARNRPLWPRLVLFSALGSLIFVLHLFAFGVYGLLVGSYEAGRLWAGRPISRADFARRAAVFVQFIPAFGLWLVNRSAGGVHYTAYGALSDKLTALMAPMNFSSIDAVLIPTSFSAAGSLLAPVFAVAALFAWWRGALRPAPEMRWPILAVIVAAAAMPNWLYGSWAADFRLPVALPFIVIAGTKPFLSRRWLGGVVTALCISLLVARIAVVTSVWWEADRHFAEFRAVARNLPESARLLLAQAPLPREPRFPEDIPPAVTALDAMAYRHMGELAILDRDAFVPTFGLQLSVVEQAARNAGRYPQAGVPLRLNQLVAGAARDPGRLAQEPASPTDPPGQIPYWVDWPHKFEYLLLLDYGQRRRILPTLLQPWAQGSFFTIYRVTPD
jgi:hypothetical protein